MFLSFEGITEQKQVTSEEEPRNEQRVCVQKNAPSLPRNEPRRFESPASAIPIRHFYSFYSVGVIVSSRDRLHRPSLGFAFRLCSAVPKWHSIHRYLLCRLIFANALQTEWDKYILVTLLFTYATVFLHIVSESSRTNVAGLLGLTSIQTILMIVGIGVAYPVVFLPSFIYFYRSTPTKKKSPIPINLVAVALIYVILLIILPTYLLYFFVSSDKLIGSILSIVLLVSPLGFTLVSFPFRFCSNWLQHCWLVNSHRLLAQCQILIFVLCAPLYFIALVSLILHGSLDGIRR